MQAEQKALVTAGFASGVAVVLVLLAFVLGWETLSLRTRLAAAHQTGRESAAELSRLQAQQASAESDLARQREQLAALQVELKNWRENAATNPPGTTGAGTRVRVYSGGRYVGTGWIQPDQAQSGEGAAVILDPPPQAASAAAPAPGQAAAVSSSFSFIQQTPSWPYLWTVGWIGCEPTNNQPTLAGGVAPEKPVAPSPPVQPASAPVVASVARTAMPARFNAFPPIELQTFPRTKISIGGQRPHGFGTMPSGPTVARSPSVAPPVAASTRAGASRPATAGIRR